MANADQVNEKITDAVAQTAVGVLAEAPSVAIGALYQTAAQATGLAMQNAVAHQQNMNQLNPSIVAQAIAVINGNSGGGG